MKIRASKAERQVDRLLFLVISYVAICASITHYPQLHDSIKQGAQVMPMMHVNSAWKGLDGGIRATTGEHNDPENGNNPVLMIILLLFLQKQNLAFAVYLFGSVLSMPN